MKVSDPFSAPGRCAERMRAANWDASSLGPPSQWSASLKTIVQMMLRSKFAMWMAWGPDLTFFCNDAYAPTLGIKQDWAIGARSDEVWKEIWPDIGPRIQSVFDKNEATWDEALLLFLQRSGYPEETYHTFSYSPLTDDDGAVRGMLCVVTEETDRVIAERRVKTLGELAACTASARTTHEACVLAAKALENNRQDFPYAIIRLLDEDFTHAEFICGVGLSHGHPMVDDVLQVRDHPRLKQALTRKATILVDLAERESELLPHEPWDVPVRQAVISPMLSKTDAGLSGYFSAGVNPHRKFDDAYRAFIDLVVGQIAAAIANANAYEEERRRVEALAEIDRAKTAFFSNISHEFRTPLTLMLGPLEDQLRAGPNEHLAVVHRNSLRLLRLVNTLLDFSRSEAGRMRATFAPTDLAEFTSDLASIFHSAFEQAGVTLSVDTPPLPYSVEVDRSMWEKIVLNLVSNAFKFTQKGAVSVSLRESGQDIELTVSDTGVGIPADQIAHVFDRFHRIEGQPGRTHEGSGIGLALVRDLVNLHDGTVSVVSVEGQGSVFTVRIPARRATAGATADNHSRADGSVAGRAFVEEALRWLPTAGARLNETPVSAQRAGRIVLADDNADMRNYVAGLLSKAGYEVLPASDGVEAMALIANNQPDLVLSDVMMPRLDGIGLTKALRAKPETAHLPIVLLSARVGEEAEAEGLAGGADDYVTKPFVSRELIARVDAAITRSAERSRLLRDARAATAQLELVANALPGLVAYVDANQRFRFNNKAFEDWFNHRREDITGRTMLETVGDDAYALIRPRIEAALSGKSVVFEATIPYKDAGLRHVEATYLPDFETDGSVRGVFVFVYDLTERQKKDSAVIESEARFRSMADNAPVMVWVTDADGLCTYLSKRWYEFTGQTEEEALGMGWLDATHPDDKAACEATFLAANARRDSFSLEYRLRRADGEYRWCLDAASPRFGGTGEFLGYIGSVIDISERKHSEDRRLLLINELNHRVKNTLAVVQALALQGLRASPDNPSEFKDMFVRRLTALANAHDLLTQAEWSGADLKDVAQQALSLFSGGDRFAAQGPSVQLSPRAAVPFSMALHELATNASKYGALSGDAGCVDLEWRLDRSNGSPVLDLTWTERGGPLVTTPKRRGFGSRLIEQGLKHELEGEVQLDFEPSGLRCRVRIPLSELTAERVHQ